ncbi:MAG: diguanylate cyclase [Clostridiales bacterium]|jgi:diguanylate cyclase (GGDEF)-like protein|nr:diguanylate cyclase [Clostridiales bacterium]
MHSLLYVEINVFALVILVILLLNSVNRAEKQMLEQKLFMGLVVTNMMMLFYDTFMWILDGRQGILLRELNIFFTAMFYIFGPVACMLWSCYVEFQINRNPQRLKKFAVILCVPLYINFILSLASIKTGWLFWIDADNIYSRGPFLPVTMLISYFYLIYSTLYTIFAKRRIDKKSFNYLILFVLPPGIGSFIQYMYYGVSLMWVCMTVSIFLIYINIQNDRLYKDYLTGVFNRRQLDFYLQQRLQYGIRKRTFAGFMIDIDSFKNINDVFGHNAGDRALMHTAEIIRRTFGKNSFIARYGGDEFVVITEVRKATALISAVDVLNKNINEFNKGAHEPYAIDLSVGYDVEDNRSGVTPIEFLERIDKKMYLNKQKTQDDGTVKD